MKFVAIYVTLPEFFFQFPMVLASAIAMFFANFYTPFGKALVFLAKRSV
jgi:hypothetical protein